MFEVIISDDNTGRVLRRHFGTHEEADRFLDRFFRSEERPRGHHVEVRHRLLAPAAALPRMHPHGAAA